MPPFSVHTQPPVLVGPEVELSIMDPVKPGTLLDKPVPKGIYGSRKVVNTADLLAYRMHLQRNATLPGTKLILEKAVELHQNFLNDKITLKEHHDLIVTLMGILDSIMTKDIDPAKNHLLLPETLQDLETLGITGVAYSSELAIDNDGLLVLFKDLQTQNKGDNGVEGEKKRANSFLQRAKYYFFGASDEESGSPAGMPETIIIAPMF